MAGVPLRVPVLIKNCARAQLPLSAAVKRNANLPRTGKRSFASNQLYMRLLQPLLAALAKAADDGALSLPHPTHIDGDGADMDTIIGAAAGQVGHARAGHHGFGGSATAIDTSSAYILALDQRGLLSRCGQCPGQRIAALPRADDDGVKSFRYLRLMSNHLMVQASTRMPAMRDGWTFTSVGDEEEAAANGNQIFEQGQQQIRDYRRLNRRR